MQSFKPRTLPHLDFLMFYLHSSPSLFFPLFFFLFLTLPSGPASLLSSISSQLFHLHSFLNHFSLTNLINHLECLNKNSSEAPKSFVHSLINGSCLSTLLAPSKYKAKQNRTLKWKVVDSRPLIILQLGILVCWFWSCEDFVKEHEQRKIEMFFWYQCWQETVAKC